MTYWTVVSRPGPVESRVLAQLAPAFRVRRHIGEGVTLRVLEGGLGPAAAPGDTGESAFPVVLLHGRGHAETTWSRFLAPLAATRRTVALDLPGFGHSAARRWSGGDAQDGLRFFVDPVEATLCDLDLQGAVII